MSTKIHAVVDALGNPQRGILTGGEVADITQAHALIAGLHPQAVVGDKGHDADALAALINAAGATVVIPPRGNRCEQRAHDRHVDKDRNLAERFLNRLKKFRRITTRYEKRTNNFISLPILMCAHNWLA